MSSTLAPPADPAAEQRLEQLVHALDQTEVWMAKAVLLAGELAGSGVTEQVEGLPLEHFLGLHLRMPRSDIRMIITAGEVLRHLPVTRLLVEQGKLSWGQVRRITLATRRLSVDERSEIDARVEATVEQYGGVDAFDPDGLVDAVDAAVDEIRERSVRERERRQERDNYVGFQLRLDGGSKFHGEADPVKTAIIVNALRAKAGQPTGAGEQPEPGQPTIRGRQYLDALADVCAEWLGGGQDRPAQPLFITHVDLSQANPQGLLETPLRGKTPRISAALCEIWARDADFRAVLFDGARPLAVSAKLHAAQVPTATRIAARARDLGDRFPGSRDPLAYTDLHHMFEDRGDRTHHPDKLVSLSRPSHRLVHKAGWTIELDPPTGKVTVKRNERSYSSLPRGTPLAKPPPRSEDRGPPDLPF